MPEGSAGWVEDEVNHYGLTEVIILKFLKDDCNISGTDDIGAPSGPTLGAVVNATYSISPSPTNGRGTIGGGIAGVIYALSASKFVVVSSSAQPAILIFEK